MTRFVVMLGFLLGTGNVFADDTADIYKQRCKGCHGEDGKAQTKIGRAEKIDDFTSVEWQSKLSDEQIRNVIENGSDENSKMKPFKDKLTPEEISGLVKHIRNFKAKKTSK